MDDSESELLEPGSKWSKPSPRRALIATLALQGVSVAEIARQVGCSKALVYHHLTRAGLRARRSRPDLGGDPQVDELLERLDSGHVDELREIAEKVVDLPPIELPEEKEAGRPRKVLNLEVPESLDPSDLTTENLNVIKALRDHPQAAVGDRIRAAELIIKWGRGQESDSAREVLDDAAWVAAIVDILVELPDHLAREVRGLVGW